MNDFELNLLRIKLQKPEIDICISESERDGYFRVFNDIINSGPGDKKFIWWKYPSTSDCNISRIDLYRNRRFAKIFCNQIIYEYFSKHFITNRTFISDTEVYTHDDTYKNSNCKKFNKFSIRIENNPVYDDFYLLLTYDGDSYIANKSIKELGISNEIIGKVFFNGKIEKSKIFEHSEGVDFSNVFPLLNLEIRKELNIPVERNFSENKYRKYYDLITSFYKANLLGKTINENIKILEWGFFQPLLEDINKTTDESNLLLFANNHTHYIPYSGIKEYGPLKPSENKPIKFIFIFHEGDKDYANKIYSYFKKGYKNFPGLQSFVKIDFDIDTAHSIKFIENNPIHEVSTALSLFYSTDKNIYEENTYVAIYISQIKKDGDNELDEVYYKIKELLLKYRITSQVIYREKIDDPSFNYYLPNIAIALLAKLGGIPWRLYRPISNDLVIGIGADRSTGKANKYIGSAFCFRNDGEFIGFNSYEKDNIIELANSIKDAITTYTSENNNVKRLIIHYYKKMSIKEEKPILDTLQILNLNIPVIIVTINSTDSKDYVLFDTKFDGKMPQSGTYVKIKNDEYLLCNNTRYSTFTGSKIEGFPLPIKIKFRMPEKSDLENKYLIRELIDQVYQFSRMYWKSVRQRNLPVTIEYSELIAKMFAHFEVKELNTFARNTLWFL
jgi:hypothetical protein